MSIDRLAWLADAVPTVIGMIHLPPLAGSPRYGGDWPAVRAAVQQDVEALVSGGVHALMLENFGDTPFYPQRVPAETTAQMTALAGFVRSQTDLPLGINVLRNDGQTALAIAHAVGAAFIRVNILCGARVTDQGLIQGMAHELLRDRDRLRANGIAILADVDVKHSAPLAKQPLENEVADLVQRGRADGVIVSGTGTGHATSANDVESVQKLAKPLPVFVGSGVTQDNLAQFLPAAAGLIVGSAFKYEGKATHPVDRERVRKFMDEIANRHFGGKS